MNYLILPDVHNRWETVEKVIKHVKADKVILLGDYFDDFGDDPHIIADVADWFHWAVNQPDRIFIAGNHDIHYWFKDYKNVRCSGYSQPKSIVINDFVKSEDWKKLVLFYNLDNNWLLSHGGVHPSWLEPDKFTKKKEDIFTDIKKVTRRLEANGEDFLVYSNRQQWHWFNMPGYSRCKNSPYYGGLLWCDYSKEFHPIRGLHQIIGHTPNYELWWTFLKEGDNTIHTTPWNKACPELNDKTSWNICLDSQPGSLFYAICENGKLTIHKTADIK